MKQLSREMKTYKGAELKAWLGGKEAVWKGIQLSWEEVGLHETRGSVFGCLRTGEGMLAVYPMVKPCKTSGLRKLPIAGVGRAFCPPLSKKSIVPARLPAEGPSVKSVKDTCMLLIGSMTVIDFEKGDEESL
jgi:hypothetical protein